MESIKLDSWKETRREKEYKNAIKRMSEKKGFFSPAKAIRLFCSECVGFNEEEVRKCPSKDCILWYFRNGRNSTSRRKPPTITNGTSDGKSKTN